MRRSPSGAAPGPGGRAVEPGIVDAPVEEAPGHGHDRCDHHREEQPAINDVIHAAGELDAGALGHIDGAPGAHPLARTGTATQGQQEEAAAAPGAEADVATSAPSATIATRNFTPAQASATSKISRRGGEEYALEQCRQRR
jgi:hypothetical protein